MKNKILNGVILGVCSSFFIACSPKKEEPKTVDKEQIKNEIQAIETAFAEAYNNNQTESITYYADDAKSFLQNKPPLEGKEAIIKSITEDALSNVNHVKITLTTNEVYPSNDGNQVIEIGNYTVLDTTNTKVNSGTYFSLFEKRNGKYVCIRDMGASDMSKP